jgi:hypothetical protein
MRKLMSFILITLIVISSIILVMALSNNQKEEYPKLKWVNLSEELNISKEINETQILLNKVLDIAYNVSSSHKYILNKFDCTQFSQTLIKELRKINVNAYCVMGYYKVNPEENYGNSLSAHTWIEANIDNMIIPIEATDGQFIDDYSQYKIIARRICW